MSRMPTVTDVHPSVSRHAIGRALVAVYEDVLTEPLPAQITAYSERLEAVLALMESSPLQIDERRLGSG